jgi:hypothetical protein
MMTAEEALKLKRTGGKLHEPVKFDENLRADYVRIIRMPATLPRPEDGR